MSAKFAGIDFDSNRVDIVTVNIDTLEPRWYRFSLIGPELAGDAFERARRIRYALPPRASWADVGVVQFAIEKPIGQKKGSSPLFRIQGGILACLPREIPAIELLPYEWKQALDLPGSGAREKTKAEVRMKAVELGAPEDWPQDAHDALCIAHAAIRLCEKGAAAA